MNKLYGIKIDGELQGRTYGGKYIYYKAVAKRRLAQLLENGFKAELVVFHLLSEQEYNKLAKNQGL